MIVSSSRTSTERMRSRDSGSSPIVKFCRTEDVIPLSNSIRESNWERRGNSFGGVPGQAREAGLGGCSKMRMTSRITGMTRYI